MASAEEIGEWRIRGESPDGQTNKVLFSVRSENANQTTPTQQYRLPFSPYTLKSGSKVVLEFLADASDGLDYADCKWRIPVVLKNPRTGESHHLIVNKGDLSGTTTATITCTAGVWQRLWEHTVPDGMELILDGGAIAYLYAGDDTA